MRELACTLANRCYVQVSYNLIPTEYTGWYFLLFMSIGFILICYGFYYITINPIPNQVFVTERKQK